MAVYTLSISTSSTTLASQSYTSQSCGSIALTTTPDTLASPQLLLHGDFSCEPLHTVMFVTTKHTWLYTLCELQLRSCCCNPFPWTPLYAAGSTQTLRRVIFGCQKSRCSCTYMSKTTNASTFVFPDRDQINSESTGVLLGLFLMQLPSRDCFASLNSCTLQQERTQTWLAQYIAKENRKICNCHIAKTVIQHIYTCYI